MIPQTSKDYAVAILATVVGLVATYLSLPLLDSSAFLFLILSAAIITRLSSAVAGILSTLLYSACMALLIRVSPTFYNTPGRYRGLLVFGLASVIVSLLFEARAAGGKCVHAVPSPLVRADEALLKESGGRFRTLIENTPDIIGLVDTAGQIIYVCPAIEQVLGYRAVDLIGMSAFDIVHPDDIIRVRGEMGKGAHPAQGCSIEYRVRHHDGSYRIHELFGNVINDGELIKHVTITSRDITRRKRIEEALRRGEERYRAFVEQSSEGIWRFEFDEPIDVSWPEEVQIEYFFKHGYLAECNDVTARMYGHTSAADIIGARGRDLMPPDEPGNMEYLRSFIRSGYRMVEAESVEVDLKGGKRYFLNNLVGTVEQGFVVRVWGTQRDITERKQFERARAETDELYRRVAFNANDLLYVDHPEDGKREWFGRIKRALGFEEGDVPYSFEAWASLIHPADRQRVVDAYLASARSGEAFHEEYRLRRADGSYLHWSDRGCPVVDDSGRMVKFIGAGSDISRERSLEEQLRHSQKMEAIGRLAGGIAHDFNNLLTAIIGHSQLLAMRIGQDSSLARHVAEIESVGRRAAALVRQLLTFSRKQIAQLDVVDISGVVLGMEEMLRSMIGEDIEISISRDAELSRVKADPNQVMQIVMNLVVNARDAMPEGGTITIETQNVELGPGYASGHLAVPPGAYVLLAISDTGTGIEADVQKQIFDPFFTTKEAGKGTGLGLSTVYGIIQQSGGHITVYSEPGLGTTFRVYFPSIAEAAPEAVTVKGIAPPQGTETILLVEDETAIRKLSQEILTQQGYTVLIAANGTEAVKIAEEHRGSIDLMLTDVVMPGLNGRELAVRVALLRPGIKVMFVSGFADHAIVSSGELEASHTFLAKPFDVASLGRKVREVLDQSSDATEERAMPDARAS